jgi:hypothetical protein
VSEREATVTGCYSKFLDALKRSDQDHLAAMLTNVDQELEIVDKCEFIQQNEEYPDTWRDVCSVVVLRDILEKLLI